MAKLKVWFNGQEVTKYCDVTMGLDYPFTLARSDSIISPGEMIGSELLSSRDASGTISMPIKIEGSVRDKRNALVRIFWVHEAGKLVIGDNPDRYWLAMPKADIRLPKDTNALVKTTIEWILYYPYSFANNIKTFTSASQQSAQSFTIDFKNKVMNSLSQNANKIWGAEEKESESRAPDSFWWEWEQPNYSRVVQQDGVNGSYQRTTAGNSTRLMLQFDIASQMEILSPGFWQKYGVSDRVDKRQWLADNLTKFKINVWSYGSGATGYSDHIQLWNGTEWTGTQSNTAGRSTLNSYSFTALEAVQYINESGYLYVLVWTNDASATVPSTIYLDYASIELSVSLPTQDDSITVVNDGDVPVPVDFEITNYGQNGFIGIEGSNDESILLGVPNEIDGGIVSKSERLFTTIQDNANGLKQWVINDGVINDWNEDPRQVGKFKPPYEQRWRLRNNGGYEYWGNPSANKRGWHGPSIYAEFNHDSNDAVGALNFQARAYVNIIKGNMQATGLTEVNISGPDKELLVSVQLWSPTNGHGGVKVRIGEHWAYIDENNARWDKFFGSIKISRHGSQYVIELQDCEAGLGTKQTITYIDGDSAKTKAAGFTYWKAMWGDKINNVSWQDPYDFWFQKDNVENYVDVPNSFADHDTITIDGSDEKVRTSVNGTLALDLQDIGSQPILAYPGMNTYSFAYSDFASRPDVTAKIREQFVAGG